MLILNKDVLLPKYLRLAKRTATILCLTFCVTQASFAQISTEQAYTGKKLFVTAIAVDSAVCGPRDKPCRSISQAIENANEGDHIFVGPGYYGDINMDGDFDDPGDEKAQLGFGCHCIILINKSLTLTSIVDAKTTLLDANDAVANVVAITADKVRLGKIRHGFTLTGARSASNKHGAGLKIEGRYSQIYGNIASYNEGVGFDISGDNHQIRENYSRKNGHGFIFAHTQTGHGIEDNIASNNGIKTGFGHGFLILGNGYTVTSNMANGNQGNGFIINSYNNADNKKQFSFSGNTSIGNTGQGVFKFSGANTTNFKNNIFGNLNKENIFQ